MNNKKSIGNHRPKAPKKIFSWVILELAGREWCTVPPPPQGGNRHLVTVPPGVGGGPSSLGGGWTWGGEGTPPIALLEAIRC